MTFVAIPSLIGPMLGPVAGGLIVDYLHWRAIFFVNIPIGLVGLYLIWRNLLDYSALEVHRLDWVGLTLFSSGVALLSYVLEVFGEHTLSAREMLALLAAYGGHALGVAHPLLRLTLFRLRTFRIAVTGSFVTRLGVGGMPFLLPLLYQVGMGYTPVQSALLILPQPLAAMSLKVFMPRILRRFGYRRVLLVNTVSIGLLIILFFTIGPGTTVWRIALQGFAFGFCSSLQFSSMNTLVYSDVADPDASMASTIASTLQQMSMSFGVATASLGVTNYQSGPRSAQVPARVHGTISPRHLSEHPIVVRRFFWE